MEEESKKGVRNVRRSRERKGEVKRVVEMRWECTRDVRYKMRAGEGERKER